MNWLDLAILAVFAVFAVAAWRTGFLRGAVALLAVAIGVVLAGQFHQQALIDLAISEEPSPEMKAGAYLFILFAAIAAGMVVGHLLRSTASLLLLGWADRSAGAVFGFLFGVILVQAVIAIIVLAPISRVQATIEQSLIGAAMIENAPLVRALLPDEFDQAIQDFRDDLDQLNDLRNNP